MENSLLYATHLMFKKMFFEKSVWTTYAYVPGNTMKISPKWKIKTKKYNVKKGTFSFDALKYRYVHDGKEIFKPLIFNFGYAEREHISGLNIDAINLTYRYDLEREVLERMCKISDEGYDIFSNNEVILEKFKGSQILIDIDLKAPDYAYMDEKPGWCF